MTGANGAFAKVWAALGPSIDDVVEMVGLDHGDLEALATHDESSRCWIRGFHKLFNFSTHLKIVVTFTNTARMGHKSQRLCSKEDRFTHMWNHFQQTLDSPCFSHGRMTDDLEEAEEGLINVRM